LAHSFFWLLSNVLYFKGHLGDLADPRKAPYAWMACGEGALALEVATSSYKIGSDVIGGGMVTRGFEWIVNSSERPKTTAEEGGFRAIEDVYMNYPDFGKY